MITDSIEIAALRRRSCGTSSPTWSVGRSGRRPSSKLVALDGPSLEIGKRFEIKQPRLPKLVWEVTQLTPGVTWTWRPAVLGGTTLATHEVTGLGGDRTLVHQRIDQRGPVGVTVGLLMRGSTRRYLTLEGEGLKARSEELARHGAMPS